MSAPMARPADPDEIDQVIGLVAEMFAELGRPARGGWPQEAARDVRNRLGTDVVVMVADQPGQDGGLPVAVAVGVLQRRLPAAGRTAPEVGYLEWTYVRPDHRRQGLAAAVVSAAVDWLFAHGAAVVDLHASDQAVELYESVGFRPSPSGMRVTRQSIPDTPTKPAQN